MSEPKWPESGGEFGGEPNPDVEKGAGNAAAEAFGGEGNPPGLRPSDAEGQDGEGPEDGPRLAPKT